MTEEIHPSSRLHGEPELPADKSISHRTVLFAALHEGRSVIENFSDAEDPQRTINCMRALGVKIDQEGDRVTVEGVGRGGLQSPDGELDCGNSGTTMRLLTGILAGAGVEARLTGDESLRSRTMKRIVDPLVRMGAEITAREGEYAPLHVRRSRPVKPISFELPIPSAQLKSSVLLAGLFGEELTEVIEILPSRDHTERLLDLPVEEQEAPFRRTITSHRNLPIPPQSCRVPGDFSAAAFWLVAAAIRPSADVRLRGVGLNPTRTAALQVLRDMGAAITVENRRKEGAEPAGDLIASGGALRPVVLDEKQVPNLIDEIPILAVAMLFADGSSEIRGAGELRHKETDRLMATAEILKRAGASFEERSDGFLIHGDPSFLPAAADYESYHDHRIAMSAAILSLMADGPSRVAGAECTAISYPGFWKDLASLT